MKRIKLKKLRFDGDTQMRDGLNGDTVADYRDALRSGAEFPPIVAFFDGSDYWIGDGYHRWHAASEAGLDDFPCDVRQGSKRDAILWACGANGSHGLRRTNADKHKAVKTLLLDDEWVKWSDAVIAEKCGVSHPFVGKVRAQVVTVTTSTEKRKGKDGKRQAAKKKQKPDKPALITEEQPSDTGTNDDDIPPVQLATPEPCRTPEPVGVISRFQPFWDQLTSQERVTLFVWINGQVNKA